MKWLTIGVTLAAFVAALVLSSHVSRQFFPSSDRPELTVNLTLRQNASIFATEQEVKRLEEILKTDPDVDHFSSYVGRGAIRFILTLNVQLANPFFGQFVVVTKDLEARERLQVKLEKVLAEQFPERRLARVAARAGAAGGLASAVPRVRPGQGRGAASFAGTRQRGRHRRAHAARALRLDGAGAPVARQDQPGPGPAARRQFGRDRRRAQRRHLRHAGDAGARRHLSGQRRGTRRRW